MKKKAQTKKTPSSKVTRKRKIDIARIPDDVVQAVVGSRGLHQHKCSGCRFSWWHSEDAAGDKKAHTCPKCGVQDWIKE